MSEKVILITAPALDTNNNVSGVSSVTNFIIGNNAAVSYRHFELGRKDDEQRNAAWVLKLFITYCRWAKTMLFGGIGVVHFNFALSKASIIRDAPLVIFAKLVNKKLVIHLHGGDYLFSKTPPGWMQFLLNRVFSGNTPVIVLSATEAAEVKKKFKAKNVHVLPNCVNTQEAAAFTRHYPANATVQLLFIGRISKTKGLDFIYSALAALKAKQLPFKFLMAGAGPEEKEYVQKFAALLQNDFEFKGVVSGAAKTALYQSCDVFLLPSLFEGLPMSLLEAMLFGVAPVVTNVGSIGGVVTHYENGLITALNDDTAKNTAAYTEQLITDKPLLEKLSRNAAAYILNNYSPAEYISRLNNIYRAA
jgi:glycosyltransferase involved in cell wall biosynthesis